MVYRSCAVRPADIFTCGSSCKYFSHANENRSSGDPKTLLARLLHCAAKDMHQSLTTFVAWRDYLKRHTPALCCGKIQMPF